jgi:hypothetical protein
MKKSVHLPLLSGSSMGAWFLYRQAIWHSFNTPDCQVKVISYD